MRNKPMLTIIVPCYNEEEVLNETMQQLGLVLRGMKERSVIHEGSDLLFVDDGSRDKTWEIIAGAMAKHDYINGVKLSRNFGHQNALLAGMQAAEGRADCIISIDSDLQDDVGVIPDFVEKYRAGYEVVYGIRDERKTDTRFKRGSAHLFYSMMGKFGIHLVPDHADYRLLGSLALQEMNLFPENNIFLRGIVPLIGFKSDKVYYHRKERFAGESKYPLKKMLAFAADGLTSFSVAPIRLVTGLGALMFVIAIVIGIYTFIQHLSGTATTGWSSLMLSIWVIGGVQMISLGVVGEYIGRIYSEVKQRPRFIVEQNSYVGSEHIE
ncbi:glycosyltransferase family 2 protein [Paenilisteria rocourtiae]|uniref:Glycosyltransferase involved in cell wall biosynthesis n=1 Tax=Listeria rocourtiae TaxID=647910 RepID=A0A4R6ZFL1_9LIST|nr:glycosyltransferase family 2 protein [Listeria rocourtiae]EUJ48937.1 glycosyl transferase family protein [Listeria rocourtiae FSL F6-920]MBC1436185.1 glycosyltransferase family 2 protein [Listeria rocourtiae]MBC1605848.1 glycosyltransferase family 2 protein [Listeria rocourtiae]TDR50694.1 glycosyltransferase involved in cell wall biosynthesis [Listeria rocourtiae]